MAERAGLRGKGDSNTINNVWHMEEERPTLRNISKEVFSEGYFERARQRARRRKSLWNLVLIPLGFGGIAFIFYGLLQIMWRVHTWFHPDHVDRFKEFWSEGIGLPAFVSSFLLVIPLLFAALPLGMLFANAVAWFILPARRAFEREAEGVKWASFPRTMKTLTKIALLIVPVCLMLSFIGAFTLVNLR